MGKRFAINTVEPAPPETTPVIRHVIEEMRRLERQFSADDPETDISRVNEWAGIVPIEVSADTMALLQRATRLSALTSGVFDICRAILPCKKPDGAGVSFLELDPLNRTVFLKTKNLQINLVGLCTGFAIDRAKELLIKEGILNGVIHTSGYITAWGKQSNGESWTIGAADPAFAGHLFSYATISNLSVTMAGYRSASYYGGSIQQMGIQQATILSPSAELSFSLAQSLLGMGRETGLALMNKMDQVTALVLDDNYRLHTTRNIHPI